MKSFRHTNIVGHALAAVALNYLPIERTALLSFKPLQPVAIDQPLERNMNQSIREGGGKIKTSCCYPVVVF